MADGNFTVETTGDLATEKQLIIYGSAAAGLDSSGDVQFNRNFGINNIYPPVAVT